MIKDRYITKLIDISIIFYALFCWFSPPVAELSSILIVGLWFVQLKNKKIKLDAILFLSILWICYIFINGFYTIQILKFDASRQINGIFKAIKLMMFIPFAYFIKDKHEKIPKYLFCACIGIFIGLILNQDWSQWRLMLKGFRSGSNKWWYLIMGLYSSTAMIISFFLRKIYNKNKLIHIVLISFLLIFLYFTIVSESRTIWFGLFITICILSLLILLINRSIHFTNKKGASKESIVLLSFLAIIILYSSKNIIHRISSPDTPIFGTSSIFNINPSSSFGMRIEAWKYALQKIKQRPILGWGIGTRMIKDFNVKNPYIKKLSHIHSTYLDLMARTGIVGFVIFISLNLVLYIKFFQLGIKKNIDKEIFYILISAIILNSIFCLTTTRLLHYDWKVYYIFFTAIIYSFVLKYNHRALGHGLQIRDNKNLT